MFQHVGALDRNAQHDVSTERNVMTAVPANVVSSPSAVMNLPAEVYSSPAVAVLNVEEVAISSDSSDSSTTESLIPVEWLQFRYCNLCNFEVNLC